MSLLHDFMEIDSSDHKLKEFAWVFSTFTALLAALSYYKGAHSYGILACISGVTLMAGILFRPILYWPHKLWMGLAVLIGFIMAYAILTILFYLVVTPIAFLVRISGTKVLNAHSRDAKTFWIEAQNDDVWQKESFERQF